MSSIDNRIVRMQFDNEDFERGVMQSMKTLDELNEKLQFKEADKGISALQVHLNNVDFSGMANAIDHIDHYFTSMTGMIKKRIKEDIVDEIVSAAKKLEQMTLGQIKSGGMARAKNIANAKFMIEGLKFDWDAVRQAADYAVTDTAYGLDAAAKAASQLAASGVDFMETIEEVNGTKLTQMHKSLRAISGVAAMTNSSYEEIAHIFTAVAGMGKLTAMQMNQLSLRGLNIASTIAEQTGKTEQEIREMVSKGMIDFQMFSDAMDSAYGEHAKEANKTFEGSLSNLKAALSRIGAIFTQPVIDKTNTFFVSLTGRIKEFQKALSDDKDVRVTEKALKRITKAANDEARAHKLSGTEYVRYVNATIAANKKAILENKKSLTNGDAEEYSIARFATHFAEAWEAAINFASKVTESLDLSWFQSIGNFLDKSAQKVTKFFNAASTAIDKVKASVDKTSASIADSLELDINDLDLLHRILQNEFGFVEERWAKLDKIYQEQGSTKTGLWLQGYMDQLAGVGYKFEQLGWTEEEFKKKQEELAKSEAQRVQEMTREEALIYGLSRAYENVTKMMDGIQRTASNLIKSFSNIADAIWRTLMNFGLNFRAQFPIWKITDGLADLSGAFYKLTEALAPSIGTMIKVGNVGKTVGEMLSTVTSFVFDTATAFIEFVTACLKAEESLDDLAKNESLNALQRTTINVLRVLNDVWRFFKAIGRIASKVIKSIGTAWNNVFGKEDFGRTFSLLSGGIRIFTDGIATAAEAIADSEVPFTVLETVLGTIFNIVNKIVNIFTDLTKAARQVVNGTEDVAEAATNAASQGKKSIGIIDTIGKHVGKAIIWLKELPDKIRTLWETLKETDGFKHLSKSFKDLKKQVKDFVTANLDPMKKSLGEVADEAEGTGETLLGRLANGIGNVADRVASFMDKIPEYGKKVKEWFESVKDWFDKTIKDLALDQLGQKIATSFGDMFTGDESIWAKIKKFAETVFDTVVGALQNVDWGNVGKGSFLTLVAANLFNFFKITSDVHDMVKGIANFPNMIGTFFQGIGKVFKSAQSALDRMSKAYLFTAMAQSLVAIAGAVAILAYIPKDDINKALASIVTIATVMYLLGNVLAKLLYGNGNVIKQKNANNTVDNSTKALVQINNSLGKLLGVAAVIGAMAGGVYLIIKGMSDLKSVLKQLRVDQIEVLFNQIKILIGAVAIIGMLALLGQYWLANKDTGKTLAGLAAVIFSIGASVFLVCKAIEVIANLDNGIPKEALWVVGGVLITLMTFVVVLSKVMGNIKIQAALGIAAVLAAMVGAITIILLEVVALAAIMTGADLLGISASSENMVKAMAIIALLIVSIGAALFLIGKGVSEVEKPSALLTAIIGMAAVMVAIGFVFKTLSKIASEMGTPALGVIILGIVATVGIVAIALDKVLSNLKAFDPEQGSKLMLSVGIAFLMISASLMIIAKAAEQFNAAVAGGTGIVWALGFLVVMCLTLYGLVKAIAGLKDLETLNTTIQSIGLAFLMMAGAMLVIGIAAQMFNTVKPDALWSMVAVLAVFAIIFGLITAAFAFGGGESLEKAAQVMQTLGIAFLMFGASILLAGVGCSVLAVGLGKLAEGIGVLATAFHEHWATVAVLIGLVATIVIIIGLLLNSVEPVAPLVLNTATTVMNTVTTVVGAIGKALKGGADKFVKWWKNLQPGLKVMIASGIVTVCGAILKASPEVLNTIKKLIWKVLDFLVDVVPTLVDKLFNLLLSLINSLADTIRKNSAKIAYAFWNLLESLAEVLIEVLQQMIYLIAGDGKIGKWLVEKTAGLKGYLRSNLAELKVYADGAEDAANEARDAYLALDGSDLAKEAMSEIEEEEAALAAQSDSTAASVDNMTGSVADLVQQAKNTKSSGTDISSIADNLGLSTDDLMEKVNLGEINASDMGIDMDQFQAMFGSVGAAGGEGIIEGMTGEVEEGGDELYNATSDTLKEGPGQAIEDYGPEVRDTTREYVNKTIQNTISEPQNQENLEKRMWSNAAYLLRGFESGIDDNLYRVTRSMDKVVKATDASFVGPMKINSPSKLFMEYGGYILQGLINGINSNIPGVEGSVNNLSDTIISQFGNPLDYISRIASGELQVDPSIQPVLDTSRIGKGAGSIGALLNGQAVTIGGLSGQIAADIGELDSRNLDVVMELRALREDMALMGDDIANMQVVMDTGALVGATAAPMDKALGRRAVFKGRGN